MKTIHDKSIIHLGEGETGMVFRLNDVEAYLNQSLDHPQVSNPLLLLTVAISLFKDDNQDLWRELGERTSRAIKHRMQPEDKEETPPKLEPELSEEEEGGEPEIIEVHIGNAAIIFHPGGYDLVMPRPNQAKHAKMPVHVWACTVAATLFEEQNKDLYRELEARALALIKEVPDGKHNAGPGNDGAGA